MKLKKYITILFIYLLSISNAYSLSVTSNINFGTIVQTAPTTILTMDASGNVTISGGTKSGASSLGEIMATALSTGSYYDRVDGVTTSTGAAETLKDSCIAQLTNVSLSENRYSKFSLHTSNSTICSGLPTSQEVPVKATLQLSGYCPEGTYTLYQASYIFNYYTCYYYNTHDCYTESSSCTQTSPTVIVPVEFTIKSSLGITEQQSLDFGIIASQNMAQQIKMDTNGNRTGGVAVNSNMGKQGIFQIMGAPSTRVYITLDKSTTLSNDAGNTMTAELSANQTYTTLNTTGNGAVNIGGTLSVNANQSAGEYNGVYTINVSY